MGVVNAIKQLMQKYSPLNFFKTWNEFNLLKICSNYFTTHYSLATDLNNQSDLILITTQLILGNNEITSYFSYLIVVLFHF